MKVLTYGGLAYRQFLDWLLDTIAAYQVDVLLVASDMFDTDSPLPVSYTHLTLPTSDLV